MTNTSTYIRAWQKALQAEIIYLRKYGSNKFAVQNGRLLNQKDNYTYYFEAMQPMVIPIGSIVRIEWGQTKTEGRVLSSEGHNMIVKVAKTLGDIVSEAIIWHDPWELLDQLMQRLEEVRKSKRKRRRVMRLMEPSMPAKHPTEVIQSNVHELILRSKYNPITFVWGPPGTGKTYTLARVAANKYFKEKKVLVLAHSNQAVDVLMTEISSFVEKKGRFKEGDMIRYGSQLSVSVERQWTIHINQLIMKRQPKLAEEKMRLLEERKILKKDLSSSFSHRDSEQLLQIENKLASILEKIHQKELQFLKEADIIGTTLAKAAGDPAIYEKEFDIVLVDEASMAYVPQVAFASSLGKRVIVCGDFKQLPPIASSNHKLVKEWLKEDIFHKAGVTESVTYGSLHPHLFLLKEQRRMHPEISSFTNQYIYQSLVGDYKGVAELRQELVAKHPFPDRASILLDTSGTGAYCLTESSSRSRFNLWQLLLSFQLIHEAYQAGHRSIGYTAPYRAQAQLMKTLLTDLYETELMEADIAASTIHRFQGSERDVMIFDTVDSYPEGRAGMLLIGRENERLINVAITRTKGKLIHVSNRAFLQNKVYPSKTVYKFLDHQLKQNQAVYPHEIGTWIKHQHPRLQWMHAKKLLGVMRDIRYAKRSVVMAMASNQEPSEEWKQALTKRSKAVKLTYISEYEPVGLSINQYLNKAAAFPFVLIDEQILWLGLPLEGATLVKPPYVTIRLDSMAISEYFLSQIM
ncbi:DEAD/DEAH box helicase [Bacillus tuaregi]|uniref:DEAD/DEAH box helicase n=1 Tax=Bacillus tuaregi TaxID=1816695 RepID=UPI0008F8E6AF|nr:AAA domain-containing protein [Bacillus tuaregi]